MGGGEQHRLRVGRRVKDRAAVIDAEHGGREPSSGESPDRVRLAVFLDRDPRDTGAWQHLAQQRKPLGEPGADDDPVRASPHAASAGQVTRKHGAQLRPPPGIAVAKRLAGRGGQRLARGRQPPGPRETRTGQATLAAGHTGPARSRVGDCAAARVPARARRRRRPSCQSPAWRSASPPRRAGRRPRRPSCGRSPGRRPAPGTMAAGYPAPAVPSAPRRAAPSPARPVPGSRTVPGAGPPRKWPMFLPRKWILPAVRFPPIVSCISAAQRGSNEEEQGNDD